MIPRYSTPELQRIWSDGHRFAVWLRVEIASAHAWESRGVVPAGAAARLTARAAALDVDALAARALEIEQTTQHDVIAFLSACEEALGDDARHLHFGMTSSDVVDTAFALLLEEAGRELVVAVDGLRDVVRERALQHKRTPCLGRTRKLIPPAPI